MFPTLKPSQSVICFHWAYLFSKPKAGQLVVAKVKGRLVIKRVKKVRGLEIYLQGDNPLHSTDSREYGAVSASWIVGRAFKV